MVPGNHQTDYISVYHCVVLQHTQNNPAQTGNDSGGDTDFDFGKSGLCAGVCKTGDVCTSFWGDGEIVSGNILSDAVGYKAECRKLSDVIRNSAECRKLSDVIRNSAECRN